MNFTIKQEDVKVLCACACTLCGAMAHLMKWGQYQCGGNEHHVGDVNTGKFTDLEPKYKGYEKTWTKKKNLKWFQWDELVSMKGMEGLVMKPHDSCGSMADLVYKKVKEANKAWLKEPLPLVDYQEKFISSKEKFNIPPEAFKKFQDLLAEYKDSLMLSPKWDGMSHSHEKVVIYPPEVEKPKEFVPLLPAPKSRWGMKMKELLKTA